MSDWATISSLATAGGTLVLAVATYGAVRSSNRSARIAEQALQEQRRPVLTHARLDDPAQKIMFADGHWLRTEGAGVALEEHDGNVYLALSLRNVGSGIAVLQGWRVVSELVLSSEHPGPEDFRLQTRDIYIAAGDLGLWQGALRDPSEELQRAMATVWRERTAFTIELLYSDQVGGQRTISRFSATPAGEDRWLGNVGRHWNLDHAGPRPRPDA